MTEPTSAPSFSIIIPSLNRPRQLRRCLESLRQIDYSREFWEVVVVDDGSAHSLEPVVTPFQKHYALKFVRTENGGPGSARNAGAKVADGEYFAFTDDDCAPDANWLSVFAAEFQRLKEQGREKQSLLGGHTRNLLGQNAYSTTSQILTSYLIDYYAGNTEKFFFTSNNFVVHSSAFWKIDGFDAAFPPAAEDRDFCRRCCDNGIELIAVPEAQVAHFHSMTLRKFMKQHFCYGQGAWYFHHRRAEEAARQQSSSDVGVSDRDVKVKASLPKIEPLSFYSGMARYPWHVRSQFRWTRSRAARLTGLLLLSQLCNALGYFRRRHLMRSGWNNQWP